MRSIVLLFAITLVFQVRSQGDMGFSVNVHIQERQVTMDSIFLTHVVKSIHAPFRLNEWGALFLTQHKDGRIDTLFEQIPSPDEYEIPAVIGDETVWYIEGVSAEDGDDTEYQFSTTVAGEMIGSRVLMTETQSWEFTGGVHGHSESFFTHYSIHEHRMFYLDDVFKADGLRFIYEEVVRQAKADSNWEIGADSLEIEESELLLDDSEYQFLADGLAVVMQMYSNVYGRFPMAYASAEYFIPYELVEAFFIPNSPIDRMWKEED